MSDPATTIVYTDGACQGNPGRGGWAWAVPDARFRSGADPATTNQRMELQAALDAVMTLQGPVRVVSDSTYVVNCFKNGWWEGWIRRGWKNSQRKDVANRDLWEPLIDEYRRDPERLTFEWVKGHSGDRMNDLVDRLAVEAASLQEGREGSAPPASLGPPDRPGLYAGRPPAPTDRAPAATPVPGGGGAEAGLDGYCVLVTGLRPTALGGWDDNLVAASVRRRLAEILAAQKVLHPDLVVTTGLGLGAEQLAAEAADESGVPYVAVLAFADQDRMWPAATRTRFALLVDRARQAVVLGGRVPTDKQSAGRALGQRDAWLAARADEAVVVWDDADESVARTLRSLQRLLGEDQVWILRP